MRILRPRDIPSSEITDQKVYQAHGQSRRDLLRYGVASAVTLASGVGFHALLSQKRHVRTGTRLPPVPRSALATTREPLTPYEHVTGYNNFYEFSTDKYGPARRAQRLVTRPWTVSIEGAVARPRTIDMEEISRRFAMEERVYRLRCVEGWSMVIPWVGFPLSALLALAEPTSQARYVEFRTLLSPEQMPEQRGDVLPWPYREGLRIDEAMHPLTILAIGLYGEVLPNQNGAPLRLVVPWKYGFKSIKSIVSLRLTDKQPSSTWMRAAPDEYGFYANVNPLVSHPRWSQARERRLGELGKRDTLLFNGYGQQVASLYTGMDLSRNF